MPLVTQDAVDLTKVVGMRVAITQFFKKLRKRCSVLVAAQTIHIVESWLRLSLTDVAARARRSARLVTISQ